METAPSRINMINRAKSVPPDEEKERRRLGEKLRLAREYLGLSQDEVAKHLGIPRTALTNVEAGQRRIDALELKRLAALYRQPVNHFTGDEGGADALPADVAHLARTAASLSVKDRDELERFAEYLRARAGTTDRKKR
jgi:transcriptional regulator with XRE-family HTH domain